MMKPRLVGLLLTVMAFAQSALAADADTADLETAIFAGGCFWCVESDFDKLDGVLETVSGYTGGHVPNASYKQVTAGGTGHREAVKITFNPARISYDDLLRHFWRTVDPTDAGGQLCDRGESYSTAIYATTSAQKQQAEASRSALIADHPDKDIVTPIVDASPFYVAEDYHQDYYNKNPVRYKFYRYRCGRDATLERLWGKS